MQHYSETEPCGTVASDGPTVPATNDRWVCRIGRMTLGREKHQWLEKNCPIPTMSTTNHTLI